jgi:propionyl-CoA carboxylase alpha chain
MGEQAVKLAKAVGYDSAGTCEFLVDSKKNFYFLEMNTRLQVEHPITEYVANIDIVEEMINIANGQKLSITQNQIKINGWAIESRIYAENPKTFLPCVGMLETYIEPEIPPDGSVRCDSGVSQGAEISVYYDSLLCKLCTFGETRTQAIQKMKDSLDSFVIQGVVHNIPLIRDIFNSKNFKLGIFDTNFLNVTYPQGFNGPNLSIEEELNVYAIAASVYQKQEDLKYSWIRDSKIFKSDSLFDKLYISLNQRQPVQVLCEHTKSYSIFSSMSKSVELRIEWDVGSPKIIVQYGSKKTSKIQVVQYRKLPNGFSLTYKGNIVIKYIYVVQCSMSNRIRECIF